MTPDELLELSQKLSQEKLYVQSERESIARLNHEVAAAAAQVCKTAWLVKQQRANLSRLTQDEASLCCLKANVLETTNFVDAFRHLNYHESKFSAFLKLLKDDPVLVAEFVSNYSSKSTSISEIIDILLGAVYGSCVSPHEEILVVTMLKSLAALLMSNPNNSADRVLTKDKCPWCQIYRAYTDCLSSCKVFLASALHQPILSLLTEDEWFYDIDSDKILERFHPQQRLNKFGPPGSTLYTNKVKEYRAFTVKQLHKFSLSFVDGIKKAMLSFPAPLKWLISHVNSILINSGRCSQTQSRHLCTQLVFDLFICPAVIDPMLYGLTSDVTVSHIARHNLMQVARILQVLAQGRQSDGWERVPDLYTLFEPDCLVGVVESIIQTDPLQTLRLHSLAPVFSRSAVFIGTQQLDTLVQAFKDTLASQPEQSVLRVKGDEVMKNLPNLPLNGGGDKATPTTTPLGSPLVKSKKKSNRKLPRSDSTGSLLPTNPAFTPQEVITITIEDTEPIGLQEEERVLSTVEENRESTARLDGAMKKTRFYLAHDQESIGNVSEYQASELADAISEAASVRSERSTNLDDAEDVDDNLSDMVSANVSGRGSPNISGRETPQSVDDGGGGDPNPPSLPASVPKPNSDLTDRFGKFGIETRVDRAMDNRSLVSDSWSTDVYASDSEPPETQYEIGEPPLIPEMISETASESAWSTDVLNSDTSERQIDRLRELDLTEDPGSESDAMSTRSTDSRRGEPHSPFVPVRPTLPLPPHGNAFPFSPASTTGPHANHHPALPAFQPSLPLSDSTRPGRLNHSLGSSFVTTSNHSANNTPASVSLANEVTSFVPLAPLQPIRTHMVGPPSNLLDMFDPLNDELLTPPINQGSSQEWSANSSATNSFVKPAVSTRNIRQSHPLTHTSHPASNWSTRDSQLTPNASRMNNSWSSQDPWNVTDSPSSNQWAGQGNVSANSNSTEGALVNQLACQSDTWAPAVEVRPKTYNTSGQSMQQSVAATNRPHTTPAPHAGVEDDTGEFQLAGRPTTWSTPTQPRPAVMSVTTPSQAAAASGPQCTAVNVTVAGAIPKRSPLLTANTEDHDPSLLLPGKKLGKEKKGVLNLIKKGRKGRTSGKGSPLRHLERQADTSSPAASENRDEVTSSASDDSGKLKRAAARRDSERSEKADSTEDILEKYRNPSTTNLPPPSSPCLITTDEVDESSPPIYDPENLEKCLAFTDAKKKLRLVLSSPALYSISMLCMYRQMGESGAWACGDNFLSQYLRVLYAESLLHQNLQLVTQIQETLRCLQRFSNAGCRKLMRALRDDYQSRVHYISYLAKSKQSLMTMQARIRGSLEALNREKDSCFDSLIQECVRVFLDRREGTLRHLHADFSRLQTPDEKADEIERCLSTLCDDLDMDEMWNGANSTMREATQLAIERRVMEKVYKEAMFPNADGDTQRDKIYSENVARLALSITPNHRKLKIPTLYHLEAPWSSAQAHLVKLNAFKTPRDKVQCVCQCVDTIMGLLKMAHTKSVPGADDFLPVFIYVLIMANPSYLLSTIQYVDSLYGSRMEGEEAYNWTQLNTAVAFIKMWLQEMAASEQPRAES